MDKTIDTLTEIFQHRDYVKVNLDQVCAELERMGDLHDLSKLDEEAFDAFCSTREDFKRANYGDELYKKCTERIKPAVKRHYKLNRHHTDYHENGFSDMDLIDILEMLAGWKGASRRSPDLSFEDSLPKAFEKYKVPENMQKHIRATLRRLGWIGK